MPLSRRIQSDMKNSSKIRMLFEEGAELKRVHGERNVADLSLGNPVLEPPEEFVQTLSSLIQDQPGAHRYMSNLGFPWVREVVAESLVEMGYFEGLGPEHIMMCSGAAAGMNVALKTILNAGEKVIVAAPYFVEYKAYVENHGGELTVVGAGDDFSLDIGRIEAAIDNRTRAIIVNSPNNPTGRIYSEENLAELVGVLDGMRRQRGQTVYVISAGQLPEWQERGLF